MFACLRNERAVTSRLLPMLMLVVSPSVLLGADVSAERMRQVYDAVKTPFKYGVVIRGEDHKPVDCPSVFRCGQKWYMIYVCMNQVGYETHLAESNDLLSWKPLGKIMSFRKQGWDAWQADGGVALCDPTWGGSCELQSYDGKYWLSYIGGALQGYEPDPLAIGIAWTRTPTAVHEWTRIAENPVLSREQPDVREFEKETLYKSQIIWDKTETLGAPFVMYYNGKLRGGYERIGMAVSKDMLHWQRLGREPVIANGESKQQGISGDPQIVRMGDLWVMFYFGAYWGPTICDTFACSTDLVHWTKWTGPNLTEPTDKPWDKNAAHKPWLLKHDGVVYHFYCACGDKGRVIALATSKEFPPPRPVKQIPAGCLDAVHVSDDEAWEPQGEQTSTGGGSEGRVYRHALPGGWFSWKLNVQPVLANRLVCTYWGGDPDRAFDILIDGVKLARQTVNHDRPGQFIDVEYTIPAELTKGKAAVTVKFQSRAGKVAGGVYGCRIPLPAAELPQRKIIPAIIGGKDAPSESPGTTRTLLPAAK